MDNPTTKLVTDIPLWNDINDPVCVELHKHMRSHIPTLVEIRRDAEEIVFWLPVVQIHICCPANTRFEPSTISAITNNLLHGSLASERGYNF